MMFGVTNSGAVLDKMVKVWVVSALTLPAASLAVTVTWFWPLVLGENVPVAGAEPVLMAHPPPGPVAVVVNVAPPIVTVTVDPVSAVPQMLGVALGVAFEVVMTGAAGGVVSGDTTSKYTLRVHTLLTESAADKIK